MTKGRTSTMFDYKNGPFFHCCCCCNAIILKTLTLAIFLCLNQLLSGTMKIKITLFFSSNFGTLLWVKVLSFDFYSKAVYFECTVSFGFHGLPLVTVKTDWLGLWGLDLGISDVIILLCSLKFQCVNAAYYICKNPSCKSKRSKLPCCILIQSHTHTLNLWVFNVISSSIPLSQDFKVSNGRP